MPKEWVRTHVLLPRETLEEVDRIAGQRRRSQFLAEAAEEKLKREQRSQIAREVIGSLAGKDIPGWETSESAVEWVRALRRERDERLAHTNDWPPQDRS